MNTEITTAARRILREYRARMAMGGRLHCWADGRTRWMTEGSWYESPGDDYVGSLCCDGRYPRSLVEIQLWLDEPR
jgi:hypothetical protein